MNGKMGKKARFIPITGSNFRILSSNVTYWIEMRIEIWRLFLVELISREFEQKRFD